MSRVGLMPIKIPQGVKVNIDGHKITVTGPKGTIDRTIHPDMLVSLEDGAIKVARPDDERLHRSLHGLTRTLVANMVEGVTKGFEKNLDIVGVGYRAEKAGDKLVMRLGLSHQVEVTPKPGITLSVEGNTRIKVSGIDKEAVGQMAAEIKARRIPDSYKGKGIRYAGEYIRLKPGKAGKAVGKKA